jgi:hypothetical protein
MSKILPPIFTPDFLESYLRNFKLEHVPAIFEKKQLIQSWQHQASGKLAAMNEIEPKSRFIGDIFGKLLGFHYDAASQWMLREEVKTAVDSTGRMQPWGYLRSAIRRSITKYVSWSRPSAQALISTPLKTGRTIKTPQWSRPSYTPLSSAVKAAGLWLPISTLSGSTMPASRVNARPLRSRTCWRKLHSRPYYFFSKRRNY